MFRERRLAYKARKKERLQSSLAVTELTFDQLFSELKDEKLIDNGSPRLFNVILEMEKREEFKNEDLRDIIRFSLKKASLKSNFLNLREFGILVTLSSRYLKKEGQIWTTYLLTFERLLEKISYYGVNVLDSKNRLENILFIFNNIYAKSSSFSLPIQSLSNRISLLIGVQLEKISNVSLLVLVTTTLSRINNSSDLFAKYQKKITDNVSKLTLSDSVSLIQAMRKFSSVDLKLVSTLEAKIVQNLNTFASEREIHHFAMVCQSLAYIKGHKSQLYPNLAQKFFMDHHNLIETPLDLSFIVDAFTKMKIVNRDIYKIIEKKLLDALPKLPEAILEQILRAAQRRYENFSMNLLGGLSGEWDRRLESRPFGELKPGLALNVVNLMNLVRERERKVEFKSYENLLASIEKS